MSFISWFVFVLFGGIGLAALPLDLIYDFCTRPKKLNASEIEKQKTKVKENTIYLRELANEVRALEEKGARTKTSNILLIINKLVFNKERRIYNDKIRKLRAGVHVLNKEYLVITVQNEIGQNAAWVLFYWLGLFGGIIFLILTLCWIAQM